MIAHLSDIAFAYPGAPAPALRDVSFEVEEGDFTLLAGPSAGGKSTLLRLFNGLIPQFHGGVLHGTMSVAGFDPARTAARRMASIAGMVFQEPEAQAIAEFVEDDIAFAMEQQGVPRPEMHRRVSRLLEALAIEHLRHRRLATLSGGERQRVAIAAVLALEPRLLLLDEPTSQLDSAGAANVLEAIEGLHASGRMTVLLAEHRLERLLPVVGKVLEVEEGRVRSMAPRSAAATLRAVPAVCELARRFAIDPVPLTVAEAIVPFRSLGLTAGNIQTSPTPNGALHSSAQRREAGRGAPDDQIGRLSPPRPRGTSRERGSGGEGDAPRQRTLVAPRTHVQNSAADDILVEAQSITVAYGEHIALRGFCLTLRQGEIIALVGPNGSGKSTLFRALSGLTQPMTGRVKLRGEEAPKSVADRTAVAALVPQDPAIALYHETVGEEVRASLRARRAGDGASVLDAWGIAHLSARHPRDLSVGQQQRVAIAAMLTHLPPVWLLDEPTRGADAAAKAWLAQRLRAHAAGGGAAIIATHDIESAARYATRVVGLDGGRMVFDLPARQAFAADGPAPTQTARLVPGAIIPAEVVAG